MCMVPGLRRIINRGVQGRDPSDVQLCSLTTPTSFLSPSLSFVLVPGDTTLSETQPKSSQRPKANEGTCQSGRKRPRRGTHDAALEDSWRAA